jgi:hypothetical protein
MTLFTAVPENRAFTSFRASALLAYIENSSNQVGK